MPSIIRLAYQKLDEKELKLAEHLAVLLADDMYDSGSLIGEILPIYWENVDGRPRTIQPSVVYRPLYYVHTDSGQRNFEQKTRPFLTNLSSHLEGCLYLFVDPNYKDKLSPGPFGVLVKTLRTAQILPDKLAQALWEFNAAANIPSKHFNAYEPTNWLDERTFSVVEASYAFVLTRNLSIQLFERMADNGIDLPNKWQLFKDEWITMEPSFDEN